MLVAASTGSEGKGRAGESEGEGKKGQVRSSCMPVTAQSRSPLF